MEEKHEQQKEQEELELPSHSEDEVSRLENELKEAVPEIFDNLNETEKREVTRELIARSASFSGPLPPPNILKAYDEIIPNGAERIFKMAENQSSHRQNLESSVVKSNSRDSLLGIISAFIISIFTVAAGAFCITSGHPVAGTILGGAGLASIVGTFIYGTRSEREERIEKVKEE